MNAHIHPQTKAHIDLWRAIQESQGHVVDKEYSRKAYARFYETKSIQANVGDYAELIAIGAKFPLAAIAIAFLRDFRIVIVTWLNARASRSLKVTVGETEIELRNSQDIEKAANLLMKLTSNEQ